MDPHRPTSLLGGLSAAEFMRRHWQKKPLLVRAACPGALAAIDRSRLVALAGRAVRRAAETLASALAHALALLLSQRPRPRAPLTSEHRRLRRLAGGVRGRAPPASVLAS